MKHSIISLSFSSIENINVPFEIVQKVNAADPHIKALQFYGGAQVLSQGNENKLLCLTGTTLGAMPANLGRKDYLPRVSPYPKNTPTQKIPSIDQTKIRLDLETIKLSTGRSPGLPLIKK